MLGGPISVILAASSLGGGGSELKLNQSNPGVSLVPKKEGGLDSTLGGPMHPNFYESKYSRFSGRA